MPAQSAGLYTDVTTLGAVSSLAVRPAERVMVALVCQVGPYLCALPVASVVETMRPRPVAPLAGAPPFVSGVSVVRGRTVPVVDGAALLGVAAPPPSRLVTVSVEHGRATVSARKDRSGGPEPAGGTAGHGARMALAVSAVVGVRELGPQWLGELPPLLSEVRPEVVTAIGVLDARTLVVLETARIVPEAVWAQLARLDPSP